MKVLRMHRGPVALSAALLILIVMVWPIDGAQAHGDCKSHAALVKVSNGNVHASGNFICTAPQHRIASATVSLWRCTNTACSSPDRIYQKTYTCEHCQGVAGGFTVDCPGDGTYRTLVKGAARNQMGRPAESDTAAIKKTINC